jgi:hypothetical protein
VQTDANAREAVQTVLASQHVSLELLAAVPAGVASIEAPAIARAGTPVLLLEDRADRHVGALLNALTQRGRGELLFVLDPAGGVFPSTLARLMNALEADPEALFSYPMVAVYDREQPIELASSLPWEPERLARGGRVEATMMLRRDRLVEIGGFSSDPRLAGWEAFELWCRCAEAGAHGRHVPQVLAWRRQIPPFASAEREQSHALMRERYPRLLAGPDT